VFRVLVFVSKLQGGHAIHDCNLSALIAEMWSKMMVNAFFVVASLMVEKFVIIYCNLVVGQA
jgi:hypothetical protein